MPHLTLEYSANLTNEGSIGTLCRKLAQCLDAQRENDQRVYPLGGIRVRAVR
ncbi:MAG: 5-carboxymethyl-2-hydroxymuconate isomerase, partial [Paraburkholderia hospita]